jgi:phosphoglycerate dehydrogenase-like enzyme
MQILIPALTYPRVRAELERIAPEASYVLLQEDGGLTRDGAAIALADTDIEIAWASRDLYSDPNGPAIREFMVAILKSENVRWMHSGGAGFDHPIFAIISGKGVRLSNSDSGAIAMAEYVLAAVLDCYQPQVERRVLQDERRWQATSFREIAGSTWLVIGLGSIGREVAQRAGAFGARVIGVRRTPTGDEPVSEMIAPDRLIGALPEADVVVLCTALNDSTRQLVDAGFLAAMKTHSLLVNVARGGVIDEAALLQSLNRGVPQRAILDVFETEPLPEDSPFWAHPRVQLTAHCSASGSGSNARSDLGFLENLARYVAGQALSSEVDPTQLGG